MPSIGEIRKDYQFKSLTEASVRPDPIRQFSEWFDETVSSGLEEPNAMTLATSSNEGVPSARIVLLKGFDSSGFVFFTNYDSFKGRQLIENPRACLSSIGKSWNARFA